MVKTYLGTPQTQPIAGKVQVANKAGGYSFPVTDWTRLRRFLILGTEGGSYYQSERELTTDNAAAVERCIVSDGLGAVKLIAEISTSGRAPKNEPALYALALAAAKGGDATRKAALQVLPDVARTGTHLLHFAAYADSLRGWGRGMRKAVGNWYLSRPPRDLAYQLVKYQSRDKWSQSDLLRLSHPKTTDSLYNQIFKWAVDGDVPALTVARDRALEPITAFEAAKKATGAAEIARLITDHDLPREAIPTQWLNDRDVWAALLRNMPIGAMIRNLGKMSQIGLLTPDSEAERHVLAQIGNVDRVRRARVHPIALLAASIVYSQGHGERGKLSWAPSRLVIGALNAAFYLAFGNVQQTGKRFLLGLDISGSMYGGTVSGIPGLTPAVASAAMALVTANAEPNCIIGGFTTGADSRGLAWGLYSSRDADDVSGFKILNIRPDMRLDDVTNYMRRLDMGGTDGSLPMRWALKNGVEVDSFVSYTDSEDWDGPMHPSEALQQYREERGIGARGAWVSMVSNYHTAADPEDAGSLDLVGFDTSTPQIIADFAGQGF